MCKLPSTTPRRRSATATSRITTSTPAGNASLAAAVIAAEYKTLVYYLGDPSGALAAKYVASIGALQTDATTQRGIAVGQAAAADIEALRANDGRNAAVGTFDPTWTPVLATPNHPEYPSQHGCFSGAAAEVLAAAAGSVAINATIWGATAATPTSLVTTRTFATVQDLLSQLVDARIYLGFHFRNSVVVGENIGSAVTKWELQRYFLPTRD
jgi:hypothetical protein